MSLERDQKVDQEIARSNQARAILEDKLFKETYDKMLQDIVDLWAACPSRDVEGREWLWQHYQVGLKFREALITAMNTGKLALVERKRSLVERAVSTFRR